MRSNLEIKREEQEDGARQVKFTVSDIKAMAESSDNGAIIAEGSRRLDPPTLHIRRTIHVNTQVTWDFNYGKWNVLP